MRHLTTPRVSRHAASRLPGAVFRWGPWLLVLGVLVTRLPFMTQTLYAFDSANYALAVRDSYNVAFHRPQPPGYPLYVAIAWLLNTVVRDANRALVLESVLLSMVAVASTTAVARALFGQAAGLLAGLLLLFTVGFWGYGEVAYPYVGLSAEMATLAYLAHLTIGGRRGVVVPLGLAMGVAAGIRWDGAVFCIPLWLWALWASPWRLRLLSMAAASVTVVAWAIPMVQLTGGPSAYLTAVNNYLNVWAPQSAYVVGGFDSGRATLAAYNLSFFVNYARQMLGIGLLLLFYALGRRFGPLQLATDYRARFLLLWITPPILTYVFTHLGEPGYVLSLAPAATILAAVTILDLRQEVCRAAMGLAGRGWRWLPSPEWLASGMATLLVFGIIGWNVQAFARGVGPGRLPDLRTRDAITSAQVAFLRDQPSGSTLALAHDTIRQLEYYLPGYPLKLMYDEYLPNWQSQRTLTAIPAGVTRVAVLDSPVQVPAEDRARVRERVPREQPRVTVSEVDVRGASAVEHGYQYLRVVP